MIPTNITRKHVLKALDYVDKNGVPSERQSIKYSLMYDDKQYPPKYCISIANIFANDVELNPTEFSGGQESNSFLINLGFDITENIQQYPIESYSWTILTPTVFLKKIDKSALFHHGTGIPKEIRSFFNIAHLLKGDRKEIHLIYKDIKYGAHFELDTQNNSRSRLFWKADFAKVLREELSDWYAIYQHSSRTDRDSPIIRLKKEDADGTSYTLDFIVPTEIGFDIESEIAEEHDLVSEGKILHYYGKKYERSPENRRKALEIHGTTCTVCGFSFEKIYGNRGRGFIEIHHTKPLSSFDSEQIINPEIDLVPVCSNCHRMLHRRKDNVLSVEDLKKVLCNKKRALR